MLAIILMGGQKLLNIQHLAEMIEIRTQNFLLPLKYRFLSTILYKNL